MACEITPKDMGMDTAIETARRVSTLKTAHTLERIMAIVSHKCIHKVLIVHAWALLVFSSLCGAQQVSPAISANLEQTAGTTSTRRSLSSSAGPTALPDDFTKLRLSTG